MASILVAPPSMEGTLLIDSCYGWNGLTANVPLSVARKVLMAQTLRHEDCPSGFHNGFSNLPSAANICEVLNIDLHLAWHEGLFIGKTQLHEFCEKLSIDKSRLRPRKVTASLYNRCFARDVPKIDTTVMVFTAAELWRMCNFMAESAAKPIPVPSRRFAHSAALTAESQLFDYNPRV